MSDHRHEPYDIYGTAATSGVVSRLESTVAGLRQDLAAAEERIRELEDDLRDILERIRAPEGRQPDYASAGEHLEDQPAAAEGTGHDAALPGTRPLAALVADAVAQECTYCGAPAGRPCVTGPDGYHLARFLGVMLSRADANLVSQAATEPGMSGIVWTTSPEVAP